MARTQPTAENKPWRFATLAKFILAPLPLIPAIVINIDWSGKTPLGWVLAAIAGIIIAAVFFEASRKVEWHTVMPLVAAAFVGMYVNMSVAMKAASVASEDDRNAREIRILAANKASSQSSPSSQRRVALVAIAGETPSATYGSQIQEAINRDIRKWESTTHCTDVTAKALGTYCAEIDALKGRKSAAEEREKIDAEAASIVEAPPSEDPFADDSSAFASGFGIEVNKEKVTPHLNGMRAIWLEVIAALGPMAILALLDKAESQTQLPNPDQEPKPIETIPAEPALDPAALRKLEEKAELQRHHDIFVADNLEMHSGSIMKTGDAWKLWKAFCAARGIQAGAQRLFTQRLRKNFPYHSNNNRPRFLNVRAKQKMPAIRLAVSNPVSSA